MFLVYVHTNWDSGYTNSCCKTLLLGLLQKLLHYRLSSSVAFDKFNVILILNTVFGTCFFSSLKAISIFLFVLSIFKFCKHAGWCWAHWCPGVTLAWELMSFSFEKLLESLPSLFPLLHLLCCVFFFLVFCFLNFLLFSCWVSQKSLLNFWSLTFSLYHLLFWGVSLFYFSIFHYCCSIFNV